MALILVRLINRENKDAWKETIEKACEDFKTEFPAVKFLALGKKETEEMYEKAK